MNYQVVTKTVSAQTLAAVRRRVRLGEVGRAWGPALDLVWAFLRQHEGLRTDGHNCFLYHHPAPGEGAMVVDFGVQVVRPFEGAGEVICTETPAGEVALTTHIGVAMANWRPHMKRSIRGAQRPAGNPRTRGKFMAIGPMMKRSLRRRSSTCCVKVWFYRCAVEPRRVWVGRES